MRRVQAYIGYLRIPTEVPIRKFPGPLGHPLTVWPGFFVPQTSHAGQRSNWEMRVKLSGLKPMATFN
jgi:hypothetical protein